MSSTTEDVSSIRTQRVAAVEQAAVDGPPGPAADVVGEDLQALAQSLAASDVHRSLAGQLLDLPQVVDLQPELALQQHHDA
ncbi:hypothetical protein AB0K02_32050 [Streptomyces sp. NPDC049597]|uniref:hypothetical protein n=1 Tax=Streptomyces sp. NPDC049597 TaxID=3155276 RepID=UPI00341474F9